ncbi:hypothetical protein MYCTH_2299854 [Thermothelomyces thermophilus ATCC 42464]|uniref:Uncharacterized protein n=1 Tax=Thermothelomyces thermophilus (strain ATCC 42464 / BCRC 31852 / DSM 1799) TaxID=573729 RepID=G2Q056_THET4|nr:uncharacterized protein MYCTH_2299854 [Thermothelomyces thermophilus ATCC 42464]AEO55730.1 hypothetical protein MYCTH_2299854 [Thermothelomyces thermophilus ATCC 42464]
MSLTQAATRLLRRDDDEDCVWVEPGPNGHVPPSETACNSYYNFNPQFAPAVAVAVIFGIFTGIHVVEAFVFKKRYAWVLIMGALWETLAFVLHSLGSRDQQNEGYSTSWTLLFLLAPLWINAFVYMTFARMVLYWHPENGVAGLRSVVIARFFVFADILSFVVQLVGGFMATAQLHGKLGLAAVYVYMAGVGLQQFFILVFLGLMIAFQRRCSREPLYDDDGDSDAAADKPSWRPLLYGLYAVLVFITIRIIFRLIEYSSGFGLDNPIPLHEEYAYALDCFPMMAALLILAVLHPGRYLRGPESEFVRLSRKEKKARKREKKEARKAEKEARKADREARRQAGREKRSAEQRATDEANSSLLA